MLDAISKAIALLSDPNNWEPSTAFTADQCADFGAGAMDTFMPTLDRIGTISAYAGDLVAPPPGSLLCDGASYLRSDYVELFGVIGTTYGAADSDHFNVPNLQRLVIVGVQEDGLNPSYGLGATGGSETVTLDITSLPSHTHTDTGHSHGYTTAVGVPINGGLEAPAAAAVPAPATTVPASAMLTNTGGDGPHNNLQPYMALHWVIQAVHG